jgi:hypothetical protein
MFSCIPGSPKPTPDVMFLAYLKALQRGFSVSASYTYSLLFQGYLKFLIFLNNLITPDHSCNLYFSVIDNLPVPYFCRAT